LKYCEDLCEDFEKYDDIILHSHLGTGKSTAICELVKKFHFRSILCITPRTAFAHSIFSDLKKAQEKFVLYKDIKRKEERINYDFIVCQLESIRSVREKYDLIIFDECESNLAQFDSTTIHDFKETTDHFKTIMNNAKKVIWSDAFILDRSLKICEILRPNSKKLYIQNEYQPYDRKAYDVADTSSKFENFVKMFNKDNKGDRNVIATGSKGNSVDVFNVINEEIDGKNNTLLINSCTSDYITKKMRNVNKLWDKYKNVIYTTSITVGISYDSEKVFDNLMLHFSCCSSTVRDMFQSSLRARTIKNNVLYYGHYSHFIGDHRFMEFQRDRLRNIIKKRDCKEDEHLEDWIIELWVYNKQEQNVNAFMHELVLDKYLSMCGYTEGQLLKNYRMRYDDVPVEIQVKEYEKIKDLDMDEFRIVDTLIKSGEASQNHKKEHKKFIFNEFLLHDKDNIALVIKSGMFDVYTENTNKIKDAMVNADLELRYVYNENMKTQISIYKDNKKEKLESLKEIKAEIGVKYTFDKNVEISKETLIKAGVYLQNNLKKMREIWGLDLRKFHENHKWRDEQTLGILNQIWTRWGVNEIRRGKQERKRINGVRVDVSKFSIQPLGNYKQFDEHCFDKTEYGDNPENSEEILRGPCFINGD